MVKHIFVFSNNDKEILVNTKTQNHASLKDLTTNSNFHDRKYNLIITQDQKHQQIWLNLN